MTFQAKFKFIRATKGALVYQEVDANGAPAEWGYKIGTLYVRKEVTQGAQPASLEITVAFKNVS